MYILPNCKGTQTHKLYQTNKNKQKQLDALCITSRSKRPKDFSNALPMSLLKFRQKNEKCYTMLRKPNIKFTKSK